VRKLSPSFHSLTRLPSNLRPTTRQCVHLVTRGNFRSRDKDGGHAIRSAVSEYPTLHANFIALWKLYIAGIGIFDHFSSCDLHLDPMTFLYELDPYSLEMYRVCKYELPTSRFSKVIVRQTNRQTDRHDRNYIPHCFAGGQ